MMASLNTKHSSLKIGSLQPVNKPMNHYSPQHSLCDVLQRCPGTEICVRHELPVHWCIQGNPVKLSQMTIRVSSSV